MRTALPVLALALCTGATPLPQPKSTEMPAADGDRLEEGVCRDRIETVRAERGLPRLNRDTASPDEAYFIAAVDKRIDGCSVMVMRNDTSDIRPLPKPDNNAGLRPAQ